MSRGTSVLLAHSIPLLRFSINSGSFVGNSTHMSSLYSLEFWPGEFILAKSRVVVLHHLQTPESLHCFTMGSPSNTGQGLQGSQSARSEPQRAWDSFLLASRVLETPTGGTGSCLEMVSAFSMEIGVEKGMSERGMLGNVPSQERKPRRRGRPRKDTGKGEEDRLPTELSVRPAPEGSVMLTNWSEPVGTTGRGSRRQKEREKAPGSPVESPTQQLERAQLAIVELYQENRELWSQLAEKNREVSVSWDREGSTAWL
jgi:hypothetical protein